MATPPGDVSTAPIFFQKQSGEASFSKEPADIKANAVFQQFSTSAVHAIKNYENRKRKEPASATVEAARSSLPPPHEPYGDAMAAYQETLNQWSESQTASDSADAGSHRHQIVSALRSAWASPFSLKEEETPPAPDDSDPIWSYFNI